MTNKSDESRMFLTPNEIKAGKYGDWMEEAVARTAGGAGGDREFLDTDTNISVRSEFLRSDYDYYRSYSQTPTTSDEIINWCMKVYDKVGIVRNVIDLMSDFACKGIRFQHSNPSVQRFYAKWFEKVQGKERSERFLNLLYRSGNVIVKRRNGKLPRGKVDEWKKAHGQDVTFEELETVSGEIPLDYVFLHPNSVEVLGGQLATFTGKTAYYLKISPNLKKEISDINYTGSVEAKKLLKDIPEEILKAIESGQNKILLDRSKVHVYHYKKDDWQIWANPMTYAILDDLVTYDKMRLADIAALDGAIANVRLWTLGVLDSSNPQNSILPTKTGINKLRNILHHNVGGGTMDLVWGPELKFQESNSQVYRFLGSEKYETTLNSIYDSLGIPSVLRSGTAKRGSGTGSFISLKVLVDRLQYGRDIIIQFWQEQSQLVADAMGFATPAKVMFDQLILADESSIFNILIQLADRDYISMESLHEHLGLIPDIESLRINRESKKRGKSMPEKSSPFHDPMWKKTLKTQLMVEDERAKNAPKTKGDPMAGRPPNRKETKKRKPKPKTSVTKTAANAIIWATGAYEKISEIISPVILKNFKKKNMRQLTQEEASEAEYLKASILFGAELFQEIDDKTVASLITQDHLSSTDKELVVSLTKEFKQLNNRDPNLQELRSIYIHSFITRRLNDEGNDRI